MLCYEWWSWTRKLLARWQFCAYMRLLTLARYFIHSHLPIPSTWALAFFPVTWILYENSPRIIIIIITVLNNSIQHRPSKVNLSRVELQVDVKSVQLWHFYSLIFQHACWNVMNLEILLGFGALVAHRLRANPTSWCNGLVTHAARFHSRWAAVHKSLLTAR